MIKTVSFAPPRGSGRSNGKAVGAKVVPAETLRPQSARAASGRTSKVAPAQTSLELLFDAPDEAPAPIVTPAPASKKASKTAKAPVAEAEAAPVSAPTEIAELKPLKTPAPVEVKAKRVRVPKDLAAQYGEKVALRPAPPVVEPEIVKKRLSKDERQARRDLIKPSDSLLERLAKLNQIPARKAQSQPRGKGWKFQCGRCGTTSYFETPGGLCPCGTIAVKE